MKIKTKRKCKKKKIGKNLKEMNMVISLSRYRFTTRIEQKIFK